MLVQQQAITSDRCELLEALVDEHVRQHSQSAQRSLESLSSVSSAWQVLAEISDDDIQASLGHVGQGLGETVSWQLDMVSADLRYRILRPHAQGGLGEVFVARDNQLHRNVAVK